MSQRLGLERSQFIGLTVIVLGTIVWVFAFTGGFGSIFAPGTKTVKANFDSVEALVLNDPVRINGVDVGTVNSTSALPGGRGGQVTMSIQSQYHVYNNASANLVWRTVLGANDAVAIDPGTKDAGPLQGPIPLSRDSNQVEIDNVLEPFHGGAQSGLRTLLSQIGPAFSNRTTLARAINLYHAIIPNADIAGQALRGEIPDTDLKNFVKNAGQAAKALSVGTNAVETQGFIESAARTLSDLGDNAPNLENTIRGFHGAFIDGENFVFPEYNALAYRLDPVIHTLSGPASQVAPTLKQFNPALASAHTLLKDATPLVHHLSPAVISGAHTAKVGVPLINQLKPGLVNLDTKIFPALGDKYAEEGGRPVYQLIGPTFIGLGALTNFFNSDGEMANLTAGIEETTAVEALPCRVNFTGEDFLMCNSLADTLGEFFSGGTGILQTLDKRPGGAASYGPILKSAEKTQGDLDATEQALQKVSPGTAKIIFAKHGGAS